MDRRAHWRFLDASAARYGARSSDQLLSLRGFFTGCSPNAPMLIACMIFIGGFVLVEVVARSSANPPYFLSALIVGGLVSLARSFAIFAISNKWAFIVPVAAFLSLALLAEASRWIVGVRSKQSAEAPFIWGGRAAGADLMVSLGYPFLAFCAAKNFDLFNIDLTILAGILVSGALLNLAVPAITRRMPSWSVFCVGAGVQFIVNAGMAFLFGGSHFSQAYA